jgi:hypothetical protein
LTSVVASAAAAAVAQEVHLLAGSLDEHFMGFFVDLVGTKLRAA